MTTALPKSAQWVLGRVAFIPYDVDVTHDLTVAGNASITGTLAVTGAQTFTGAANVVGNFTVATNKFQVLAASGNTTVAGTLAVTGASTFTAAIQANGSVRVPVQSIAAAGSTVTDATQLIEGLNVVSGANGTVGVKLPATPAPGAIVYVKGTTSGTLKIWPDAAATINAISSNGAFTTGTVAPVTLIALSATQWYTFPLVAS